MKLLDDIMAILDFICNRLYLVILTEAGLLTACGWVLYHFFIAGRPEF